MAKKFKLEENPFMEGLKNILNEKINEKPVSSKTGGYEGGKKGKETVNLFLVLKVPVVELFEQNYVGFLVKYPHHSIKKGDVLASVLKMLEKHYIEKYGEIIEPSEDDLMYYQRKVNYMRVFSKYNQYLDKRVADKRLAIKIPIEVNKLYWSLLHTFFTNEFYNLIKESGFVDNMPKELIRFSQPLFFIEVVEFMIEINK